MRLLILSCVFAVPVVKIRRQLPFKPFRTSRDVVLGSALAFCLARKMVSVNKSTVCCVYKKMYTHIMFHSHLMSFSKSDRASKTRSGSSALVSAARYRISFASAIFTS